MHSDGEIARVAAQAEANAALEGIGLDDDEKALVERQVRGEITDEAFKAATLALATAKATAGYLEQPDDGAP